MADLDRRRLLQGLAGGLAVGSLGALGIQSGCAILGQPKARVSVLKAVDYDQDLSDLLYRGIADYPHVVARAKGGRVVLKPNLVEVHAGRPINTHATLIASAAEAFLRHGAGEVLVAEGPGHHRDTELLLERSGLRALLKDVGCPFVDLNIDTPAKVQFLKNFTGLGSMQLASTAVGADLLVSVAKLKTHHWVGCTLTMKNLFGTVPGSVYGWPKNPLHYAGIEQSIVDIWQGLAPGFGIVDGIVGMEGDGPIMGTAKQVGLVLMGDNLPAVDATAARVMGLDPHKIGYLRVASRLGGSLHASRIELFHEALEVHPFKVLPQFEHLRA